MSNPTISLSIVPVHLEPSCSRGKSVSTRLHCHSCGRCLRRVWRSDRRCRGSVHESPPTLTVTSTDWGSCSGVPAPAVPETCRNRGMDSIVVRGNPSLAFMLTLYHWNYMNAIFLQLKECCQEGMMENSVNSIN